MYVVSGFSRTVPRAAETQRHGGSWFPRACSFAALYGNGYAQHVQTTLRIRTIRRRDVLRSITPYILVGVVAATPGIAFAQSPKAATYIRDEEIKKVNSLPGVGDQRMVDRP